MTDYQAPSVDLRLPSAIRPVPCALHHEATGPSQAGAYLLVRGGEDKEALRMSIKRRFFPLHKHNVNIVSQASLQPRLNPLLLKVPRMSHSSLSEPIHVPPPINQKSLP